MATDTAAEATPEPTSPAKIDVRSAAPRRWAGITFEFGTGPRGKVAKTQQIDQRLSGGVGRTLVTSRADYTLVFEQVRRSRKLSTTEPKVKSQ